MPSTPTRLILPSAWAQATSWPKPTVVVATVVVARTRPAWSMTAATWRSLWVSTPTVTWAAGLVLVTVISSGPSVNGLAAGGRRTGQ